MIFRHSGHGAKAPGLRRYRGKDVLPFKYYATAGFDGYRDGFAAGCRDQKDSATQLAERDHQCARHARQNCNCEKKLIDDIDKARLKW